MADQFHRTRRAAYGFDAPLYDEQAEIRLWRRTCIVLAVVFAAALVWRLA